MIFDEDLVSFLKSSSGKINAYDVHLFADENTQWFADLKELVQYAYELNDGTPVTFVLHSMGGPMLLHFLQLQTQEWKDKYISKAITLNAAWGGTVQSVEAIVEGYNFGSTVIQQNQMRQIQRSSPSLHWLMPHTNFWSDKEVFMRTKDKNYTVANYEEFFRWVVIQYYNTRNTEVLMSQQMNTLLIAVLCSGFSLWSKMCSFFSLIDRSIQGWDTAKRKGATSILFNAHSSVCRSFLTCIWRFCTILSAYPNFCPNFHIIIHFLPCLSLGSIQSFWSMIFGWCCSPWLTMAIHPSGKNGKHSLMFLLLSVTLTTLMAGKLWKIWLTIRALRRLASTYIVSMGKVSVLWNGTSAWWSDDEMNWSQINCLLYYFQSRIDYNDGYGSGFTKVSGDGDGTVNIRSLRGCLQWENAVEQANHPIYHHDLYDAEHYNILKDPRAINLVLKSLIGVENYVAPNITERRSLFDDLRDFKFRFL